MSGGIFLVLRAKQFQVLFSWGLVPDGIAAGGH